MININKKYSNLFVLAHQLLNTDKIEEKTITINWDCVKDYNNNTLHQK